MHTLAKDAPDVRAAGRAGRLPAQNWWWWAGGAAAAAAVLAFCYLRVAGTTPVVSDGAGDALQGWDMLHGNLLLHGWRATDVPFLTTELPQYALVEAVAGLRPEVVHICAAMTYTLLVLLAAFTAKGRAAGAAGVTRAVLAAVVMLAPQPGAGTYLTLSSPDHIGTAVPLLLLALLLDWAPRRWWVPLAGGLVLAWGLAGDPLVLIVGVLPLTGLCLVRAALALHRSQATARALRYELGLAAAAAAAMVAARLVTLSVAARGGLRVNGVAGLSAPALPTVLSVRNVLSLFGADIGNVPSLWGGGPGTVSGYVQSGPDVAFAVVHLLGVAVVVAAVAVAARRLIRSLAPRAGQPDGGSRPDMPAGLIVTAIVVNVGIFLFMYPATDMFAGHETGPALPLGAALAGRTFGGPLASAVLAQARRTRALARSGLVAIVACYSAMLGYAAAQPQVPPANVALAAWLAGHGLHSGLAGYWDATSVTLDSAGAVSVAGVIRLPHARLPGPYRWEADMRLFNAAHRADFLVLSADLRETEAQAIAAFGTPASTYHFRAYTIMVWHGNLLPELGPAAG